MGKLTGVHGGKVPYGILGLGGPTGKGTNGPATGDIGEILC